MCTNCWQTYNDCPYHAYYLHNPAGPKISYCPNKIGDFLCDFVASLIEEPEIVRTSSCFFEELPCLAQDDVGRNGLGVLSRKLNKVGGTSSWIYFSPFLILFFRVERRFIVDIRRRHQVQNSQKVVPYNFYSLVTQFAIISNSVMGGDTITENVQCWMIKLVGLSE